MTEQRFDPYATLEALESRRVNYVLIGAFARVVQGTEELTRGVDLAPSLRGDSLSRLARALEDLDAVRADGAPLPLVETSVRDEPVIELRGRGGQLKIVAAPAGTRGATTTFAGPRVANRSGEASARESRRSATSPAWPPPSAASKT
jgi:hypothetical protein